jgi:hypothetical protein
MAGKQDGANDDVSFSAGCDKEAPSSLSKAAMAAGPPCHWPMESSDMEVSSEEEDDDEVTMVIASEAISQKMRCYQMKLLTHKKNVTGRLMKAVKTMFNEEWHMEMKLYDPMNEDIEDKPICNSDELPEREDERVAYFPSVYDKKNKDGTLVVFWLTIKHSHVKWRKILEKEKKLQDLKLYIGVHKLSSLESQIIGFVNQKLAPQSDTYQPL